jgi:hypothetical protein
MPQPRSGRAGAGPDTAWSRSRTPHRGRSPNGRGWPGCPEWPGRAGPPTRAAPMGRAVGRCAAPPPPLAARRWRRGWAGTVAPSWPPWPPARQGPAPASLPAGCRGLHYRHRWRGWRRPAGAGSGSRPSTRPPAGAATSLEPSFRGDPRLRAPAALPPADRPRCRPAAGRGRRPGGRGWPAGQPG